MLSHFRPSQFPLRLRLTIWYTVALGIILVLFSLFLYVQVRRSLISQVDSAIVLVANQALVSVNETGELPGSFESFGNPPTGRALRDDLVIYLINQDELVLDVLSNEDEIPTIAGQDAGFRTVSAGGDTWRVYRQAVDLDSGSGWIQVTQELDLITDTLTGLQTQILAGLPLALLLAGLGGYFLAYRALRPIDNMTETAQTISAGDLEQRIHYEGPHDEVGRLARTFDSMLDRLQAAFVRERRFTGDAAHELRTPLTALKGQIGVTLSQPRNTANYQQALREMESQVDRLIRLSSDLLFMARLDQGQFRPQREQIGLEDFLGAVVDQIRPLAAAKSIGIEEFVPAGLSISGDMDLLIRLFLNLLDNAVKYTPENGRVTVLASRDGASVKISVVDTGPGIAADHLPLLFERFYRADVDRARLSANGEAGGAGLGLAIAHEIARMHDGRLLVESELGKGTSFVVILPGEPE